MGTASEYVRGAVGVDGEKRDSAGMISHALRVEMEVWRGRSAGSRTVVPMSLCHSERGPVVGARLVGFFIEQAVVARREGVVHVRLYAELGQQSQLIQVAESYRGRSRPSGRLRRRFRRSR